MASNKRPPTPDLVLRNLKADFASEFGLGSTPPAKLLAAATLYDKAYEIECLLRLIDMLRQHLHRALPRTNIDFSLQGGSNVAFRSKGGPVDRNKWSYVRLSLDGIPKAEIWVDIEFWALSADSQFPHQTRGIVYGKAHELDLVVVSPNTNGRPLPSDIYIGVECKHRSFNKALLKELLGVRREMCMRSKLRSGHVRKNDLWWGSQTSNPDSGLVLFCSENNVSKYRDPAEFWGIEMSHHPF
ncbi:hypothetical protein [Devosia beringensis]|uniref:hypothetical protein n=1 Tax=Devosia beringensis TaxID=2657486 RepID=UPI00186B91DB|nr:hypothetical protein [Devosia beringensis]